MAEGTLAIFGMGFLAGAIFTTVLVGLWSCRDDTGSRETKSNEHHSLDANSGIVDKLRDCDVASVDGEESRRCPLGFNPWQE